MARLYHLELEVGNWSANCPQFGSDGSKEWMRSTKIN